MPACPSVPRVPGRHHLPTPSLNSTLCNLGINRGILKSCGGNCAQPRSELWGGCTHHPKAILLGKPRVPEMKGLANSYLLPKPFLLIRVLCTGSTAPCPSHVLAGSPPGWPSPLSAVAPSPFTDIHSRGKLTGPHPRRPRQLPAAQSPSPMYAYEPRGFGFPGEKGRQACERDPWDGPDRTGRTLLTAVSSRPCL